MDGAEKEKLEISVETERDAVNKWIFMGKIIDQKNKNYAISSYYDDTSLYEVITLTIVSMSETTQGIYTFQSTKNGCIDSETIYLNMK